MKITAQVAGKNRVGSGVVVKLDEDHVYIATASHVIEGDQHPNVFFYAAPHRSYRARVLGLEGGNPAGLAALLVEGKIPSDLVALSLDQATAVSGGEPIILIGYSGHGDLQQQQFRIVCAGMAIMTNVCSHAISL